MLAASLVTGTGVELGGLLGLETDGGASGDDAGVGEERLVGAMGSAKVAVLVLTVPLELGVKSEPH